MLPAESSASFRDAPFEFLEAAVSSLGDALWLDRRLLAVTEPLAARAVLANEGGRYREHSDFYHTHRGYFGPRAVQLEINRLTRELLQRRRREGQAALASRIHRELHPRSEWPAAGSHLLFRHLAELLVSPERSPSVRDTVARIVERGVIPGGRERHSALARAWFRHRSFRALAAALREERRNRRSGPPRDVLDILARAAPPDLPAGELAELFPPFLFAMAGSVGFTLGWCLYLLGMSPPTEAPSAWIVRESLRLWPIAWLLVRHPAEEHVIAGERVTPDDEVAVSPYLLHRHPDYWDEPQTFRPQRWAETRDRPAYLPFGWGPHTCAAASFSLDFTASALTVFRDRYRLKVVAHSHRPQVSAFLAPPCFTLELTERAAPAPTPFERR